MQPDLPETYYLDNVETLFAHVRRVYGDLLDPGPLDFLDRYDRLGDDARKLCIRLLNRSHDCYRRSKLAYPEIESFDDAIAELTGHGLIELNGAIENAELLALFTLAELRQHLGSQQDPASTARLRRGELEAWLLETSDSAYFEGLSKADDRLTICCRDEYLLCQMLFFGNLNQSMTDFVLHDLGLQQYETYPVDAAHRPYRSSDDIRQHWLLYQLQALYELGDKTDSRQLRELAVLIPSDIDAQAPAYRKSERLRNDIARQLERLDKLKAAAKLYRKCRLPPSRERRARIHDHRGRPDKAVALCADIIEQPFDDQELQFACQFALRLCKRHDLPRPARAEALRNRHRPDIIDLELEYQDSVELAVAEYYQSADADGVCAYVENSLFNAVLGLLIWEVVFAPLPGAFFNPFQYRPSDFYAHDFHDRRKALLAATWAEIDNNDDIWRIVEQRWEDKYGLMNPLVNWQWIDLDLIQLALQRIEHTHWRAIFARILNDLRNNRSGFPDLVHFPAGGGYELLEVKGPGDTLQQNQQRWMQYFAEHDIPHKLVRVAWQSD